MFCCNKFEVLNVIDGQSEIIFKKIYKIFWRKIIKKFKLNYGDYYDILLLRGTVSKKYKNLINN